MRMLSVPKAGVASADAASETAVAAIPDAPPIDPMVIVLSQSIKSHAGEQRTLRLREPVAADYIEIGAVPFDVRGDADNRRATVDFKCASRWASRLTGHDEIILGQLASKDWLVLVSRINSLLLSAGLDVGN